MPAARQMADHRADTWDCDYLDLVQPAYIVFGKNGRGEFAFGAIEATLELEYAPRIVFFNWTGFDEGDEVSGSGSADSLKTTTPSSKSSSFHNGDDAVLKACRL